MLNFFRRLSNNPEEPKWTDVVGALFAGCLLVVAAVQAILSVRQLGEMQSSSEQTERAIRESQRSADTAARGFELSKANSRVDLRPWLVVSDSWTRVEGTDLVVVVHLQNVGKTPPQDALMKVNDFQIKPKPREKAVDLNRRAKEMLYAVTKEPYSETVVPLGPTQAVDHSLKPDGIYTPKVLRQIRAQALAVYVFGTFTYRYSEDHVEGRSMFCVAASGVVKTGKHKGSISIANCPFFYSYE